MTLTRTFASLALAGLLSASSLAAMAASDTGDVNNGTPVAPSGKHLTQGTDKAAEEGNETGISGQPGSMSKGADSGTTDGGPGTMGASKGEGASGAGAGGDGGSGGAGGEGGK